MKEAELRRRVDLVDAIEYWKTQKESCQKMIKLADINIERLTKELTETI